MPDRIAIPGDLLLITRRRDHIHGFAVGKIVTVWSYTGSYWVLGPNGKKRIVWVEDCRLLSPLEALARQALSSQEVILSEI